MNSKIKAAFALPVLALALSGLPAFAQEHADQDHHDNSSYRHHDDWKKGSHIRDEDWSRGDKVDYHQYHLQRPPSGHEGRRIDGNFVLANPNGVIVSVRPAPRNHERSHDEHPQ
jgi:Ni/Co efflux regulator RcnB